MEGEGLGERKNLPRTSPSSSCRLPLHPLPLPPHVCNAGYIKYPVPIMKAKLAVVLKLVRKNISGILKHVPMNQTLRNIRGQSTIQV